MAKQANTLFLEDWLRIISGSSSGSKSWHPSSASAQAIIQAWAELRDSFQRQLFNSQHLQSLKTLRNSQASLHVADPQAKLIISILSSPKIALPQESYPHFLRILYIWVRKSLRPSSVLIDSTVKILSNIFSTQFESLKSPFFLSEGVLLSGGISLLSSTSESSKIFCLELLCRLLEEEYSPFGLDKGLVPDLLAGIGYALSSSINVHYVRLLDSLFGIWEKESGPVASVSYGLMILHLTEWVMSALIGFHYLDKVNEYSRVTLESPKENYAPFAIVMAASGVLRVLNRSVLNGSVREVVSRIHVSAEDRIESVAGDVISRTREFTNIGNDFRTSLLLQCISLALARSGPVSSRAPFLKCTAFTMVNEIFPLRQLYTELLAFLTGNDRSEINFVKEHLNSVPFKEAGAITGVLCNQYASADEESRVIVENLLWGYCKDIYVGHRKIALALRGREDGLLGDLEKIAESAFLMVVVFALAVTKVKLNSKYPQENQMDTSVKILVSFSCVEYFRRIRLPEYMDTIRGVVVSVQENESACVSFIDSMPTYHDLTNGPDASASKIKFFWTEDEVQTARILFYLRVIPTCIERLPSHVFRKAVASTMFLYLGHPSGKVARASHSMFVAFVSGKDINYERSSAKEELVFYYIERSLSEYPGITPFEGMASGVTALVRRLPAGSPAIFYCIHCLTDKALRLCSEDFSREADMWKTWQGDLEPSKKILDLLLRLISLVDIQVLPNLMKLLAQLIVQLPIEGQNMVLNELYSQVAESDDVTRKPLLVSWLQSLSYICSQGKSVGPHSKPDGGKQYFASAWIADSLKRIRLIARL